MAALPIFSEKERFIHRDLSWLLFNQRVLEESLDMNNPLLERVKFLAIFVGNLDEYFMVRVAGIKNLISSSYHQIDKYGFYPQEIFVDIKDKTKELVTRLYDTYESKIVKELAKHDVHIHKMESLSKQHKSFANDYFEETLYPIITPMAVDPGHPFPNLPSRTIALAALLKKKEEDYLAIIPIPKNVPRLVRLPSVKQEINFVLVEDVIRANLSRFFKGFKIEESLVFRVMRDSEYSVEEEFTPDLLKAIEAEVSKRILGKTVYLETEKKHSAGLLKLLCERLDFPMDEVISLGEKIDLTFLFELAKKVDKPELKYPSYLPSETEYTNIFDKIKERDFMVHLPYQSFHSTVDLIESAAKDKDVLAIKITLYRTNRDSAIIEALKTAAKNKKQVTAIVEIKARFDEERNINWARELETSGVHVIYGIPNLKIHSKMTLVVREEEGHIQRYVHLSTGNYNEITALGYTDIGYFTANEDVADDVSDVFNVITGYSTPSSWQRITTSPDNLRPYLSSLIDREIEYHKKHKNGLIRIKINSLEDPQMIDRLYAASKAGVKVQLIVRGICCLIPGVEGLSEHIQVKSIVGRFLEHTRVFIFNSNDNPRIFMGSADLMGRNLDRRIEVLFEIVRQDIKNHLTDLFKLYWEDDMNSKWLTSKRQYEPRKAESVHFNVQEHLINFYKTFSEKKA